MGAKKFSTQPSLHNPAKDGSGAPVLQVEEVLFCVAWEEGLAVGLVEPQGLEGRI